MGFRPRTSRVPQRYHQVRVAFGSQQHRALPSCQRHGPEVSVSNHAWEIAWEEVLDEVTAERESADSNAHSSVQDSFSASQVLIVGANDKIHTEHEYYRRYSTPAANPFFCSTAKTPSVLSSPAVGDMNAISPRSKRQQFAAAIAADVLAGAHTARILPVLANEEATKKQRDFARARFGIGTPGGSRPSRSAPGSQLFVGSIRERLTRDTRHEFCLGATGWTDMPPRGKTAHEKGRQFPIQKVWAHTSPVLAREMRTLSTGVLPWNVSRPVSRETLIMTPRDLSSSEGEKTRVVVRLRQDAILNGGVCGKSLEDGLSTRGGGPAPTRGGGLAPQQNSQFSKDQIQSER